MRLGRCPGDDAAAINERSRGRVEQTVKQRLARHVGIRSRVGHRKQTQFGDGAIRLHRQHGRVCPERATDAWAVRQHNAVHAPTGSGRATVVRTASPAELHILIRCKVRKVDDRGDEAAGVSTPSLPSADGIAERGIQQCIVTAAQKSTASRNDVLKRIRTDLDFQHPTIITHATGAAFEIIIVAEGQLPLPCGNNNCGRCDRAFTDVCGIAGEQSVRRGIGHGRLRDPGRLSAGCRGGPAGRQRGCAD